jgi:protein SCO1/2
MRQPALSSRSAQLLVLVLMLWLTGAMPARAQPPVQHKMTGLVVSIDPSRRSFVVSHDSIPGVMAAMTMPFDVRDSKELVGIVPGTMVAFTLVLTAKSARAEHVQVVRYETVDQDPLTAQRLALLKQITSAVPPKMVAVGEAVPDFTLTDQARNRVTLSQLRGKVVALNFIYTSCALPQFCFKIANHFGVLQQQFNNRMGKDLVLLTVTFDPARDTPERLAEYASQWKADSRVWHFLTGGGPEVERVCNMFGVDFFADEGLVNHSLHTLIINRQGNLVANIEGNRYTSTQLVDLVQTALRR